MRVAPERFHAIVSTAAVELSRELAAAKSPEERAAVLSAALNQSATVATKEARDQLQKNIVDATCELLGVSVTPCVGPECVVAICVMTYHAGQVVLAPASGVTDLDHTTLRDR